MTGSQPIEPVNEPGPDSPAGGQPPSDQPPQQPFPTQQPYTPAEPYTAQQQPYTPPQQPYSATEQYPQQPAQPYPAQPYPAQPYPGQQPYEAQQPYQGQAYPPQAPQPYPPQSPQPYTAQGQFPPGAYPPAGAAYSATPGAYPQAPGTYPQGPGPYQQVPGAYPPDPNQPAGYPNAAYQPMPGPKPKGKGPLILGITAGVIVLAIGATFLLQPRSTVAPLTPAPSGSATVVVQTVTAESAVQGYLEALAKGDANTALAYAATAPADASMLTNEVLAAGLVAAPIADIKVAKGSGGASSDTIEATYTVGGVPVSASFPASKVGGEWKLQRVVANVNLASLHPDQIALRLNGAPVSGEDVAVFPGVYSVSADDSRYALTATTFLVKSPDDSPDTYSMTFVLSTEGRNKVRAAAQKKLTSCLKQRSLKPSGCGFSTYLPGSNKPRNSTIRWKVTKGATAMKKLKPAVIASDPTVVRAPINVQLRVDLSSTNGRRWYGFSGIYAATAVLSGSGIKVTLG